jgi:ankyrin repeat protein
MEPSPGKRLRWIVLLILLLSLGVRGWFVYASTTQSIRPLVKAVKQGDTAAIRTLVQQGNDPNMSVDPLEWGRRGRPLLLYAIEKGDLLSVQALLEAGANPDLIDAAGNTPLRSAVIYHRTDIAQCLLEHGATVDMKSRAGKTALFQAIEHSLFGTFPELIKLLLSYHADVNTTDRAGVTPLMLAAGQNDGFLCFLLLAHGANRDARNQAGRTALRYALEGECRQTAQDLLRDHAHWDIKECDALIPGASGCGMTDFVQELLDCGAKIDIQDSIGNTPLMHALRKNQGETAHLLLERGADIALRNQAGGSPLIVASGSSHPDIVELLLAKGEDVNQSREDGFTPLMFAAARGNLRITDLLIRRGADVNAKDKNGNTPLNLVQTIYEQEKERAKERARTGINRTKNQSSWQQRLPGEHRFAETLDRLKAAGAKEDKKEDNVVN